MLAKRITANALAGSQTFTDGSERLHMRARLTWQAVPEYGLDAQLRWRQYQSRDDAVETAYFNPDRYSQWTGVLDMSRRLGGWTMAGAVGAGSRQSTAPSGIRSARQSSARKAPRSRTCT